MGQEDCKQSRLGLKGLRGTVSSGSTLFALIVNWYINIINIRSVLNMASLRWNRKNADGLDSGETTQCAVSSGSTSLSVRVML